jgi:hypothetical protein
LRKSTCRDMLRYASAVAAAVALLAPSTVAAASKPPKVGEVHYFKESGAQGPDTELEVFLRHTPDSVKLKTEFDGEKAKAIGREHAHVDTRRYGHPWVPDPEEGRRGLLSVMKASLAQTGAVTLKIVADNAGGRSKTEVEIVYSECHQEPPIYPFTCIVEP